MATKQEISDAALDVWIAALGTDAEKTAFEALRAAQEAEKMDPCQIDLDCAPESDTAEGQDTEIKAYAERYGCRAALLERSGPAGGNPLYRFFGTESALRSLCLAHTAGHEAASGAREATAGEKADMEFLAQGIEHEQNGGEC